MKHETIRMDYMDGPEALAVCEESIATRKAIFETSMPSWEQWEAANIAKHHFVDKKVLNANCHYGSAHTSSGLIKDFPEADYFVIRHNGRYDLHKTPDRFFKLYGFRYREDLEAITNANYDALFIVYACFDFRDKARADVQHHLEKLLEVIDRNDFKTIVGFSNDDSHSILQSIAAI